MSFLNPILLYLGLAGVSVPILIHLLNRRKFQKVVWAAMRFLRISVEQNQRRLKIEDLVLLVARCLLALLLGLTLARPALKHLAAGWPGSQVTAVLILDHSYSMGLNDGTGTCFEKARQAALRVLDTLRSGSSVAVLLASDIPQPLVPEPTYDLNLVRRVVRNATLSDRPTELGASFEAALNILRKRPLLRGEIYLFTDGQALGWRRLGRVRQLLDEARGNIRAYIMLVGHHEEENLGLSDLRLASGLAPARQPLRFEARVSNYGREEARQVRVSLRVNSDPACDEFTLDSLPPGESRGVSLFARLKSEGFHSVTARLGGDRLGADDSRTLVVRALKELRVLLVDGDPGTEPREAETFFLRHALQPVPPEARPNYFIRTTVVPPGQLEGARLADYDVVVLANVAELARPVIEPLRRYVDAGGGLMVFPGDRVRTNFYNGVLWADAGLLPAVLGPVRGQADQDTNYFSLQARDYQHPIVSLWNDPASGSLGSARFYRAYELLLELPRPARTNAPAGVAPGASSPGPAGDPRVILRFADERPAVMERDFGRGRVLLFASTADTGWNDLAVRPAFVPLVHRALGWLAQRQDEELNVWVGAPLVRRVPTEALGQEALILRPGRTDEVLREARRVESVDGWPVIRYEETDLGGLYTVRLGQQDGPPAVLFAAQPDPGESVLDELSPEQKRLLADVARVVEWSPQFDWRPVVERERHGAELWWPLLVAVLALATLEMVLAQWFSASK